MTGGLVAKPLKIVVFGLSLSSSWGNGHATTYRALLNGLAQRGHDILFLERDVPWYADHRDLPSPSFCRLLFYKSLIELNSFLQDVRSADVVIVGSYVPDAIQLTEMLRPNTRLLAFYDIDTPVTLAGLERGDIDYISKKSIAAYDLYLSFTAGPAVQRLEQHFGARRARAFFCAVDPNLYKPSDVSVTRWTLGYLGTYSPDRQPVLDRLLLEPARRRPDLRFVVAGPQYPDSLSWPANVERIEHLPPNDHPEFYNSLAWTLNVTRADMVAAGYSPSVRLFEAAACGTPIISDVWPGLETIFAMGKEIATASGWEDVLDLFGSPESERQAIGRAGRARVLSEHTADLRAQLLERYIDEIQR